MIRVRLKIGNGEIVDTQALGLIYLDSDKRLAPPTKGFETTSYPEEEGEHILPKTVDDAFDYKVKFFIQADSIEDANTKIDAFNSMLHGEADSLGSKEFYQVTFFNDYKRHKIVGYPFPIDEATEFWRDPSDQVNDIVVVEWTIRVTKPSLCEFKTPFSDDTGN